MANVPSTDILDQRSLANAWLDLRSATRAATCGRPCRVPADDEWTADADWIEYIGGARVGMLDLVALDGSKLSILSVTGDQFDGNEGAMVMIQVGARTFELEVFEWVAGDEEGHIEDGCRTFVHPVPRRESHLDTDS